MSEVVKYPSSSNVAELEYMDQTEDASAKLIATFKDGKRYAYSSVPREVWDSLKTESLNGHVGNAFARHIRQAGFAFARLDDDLDLEDAGAGRPLDEAPRRRYQRIDESAPRPRAQPQRTVEERKASAAERRRTKAP